MPAIKLEHTLQRKGGTEIPMPITSKNPKGKTYHFKPEAEGGAHVAEVDDSVHLKSFLSIEGFELADDEGDDVSTSEAKGESGGEAGGAAPAGTQAEKTANAESTGGSAGPVDTKPSDTEGSDDTDADLKDVSDEKLREIYKDEVGKDAHHNASEELMQSRIMAARKDKSA